VFSKGRVGMPGDILEHPRLAAIFDAIDPDRSDLAVYVAIADELGARRVLDAEGDEDAAEADVERTLEVARGDVCKRSRRAPAASGIVDGEVEPPERRGCRFDEMLDGVLVGHIDRNDVGATAGAFDLAGNFRERASSRAGSATAAPSTASALAVAAPMPRLAPVTIPTFPLS
jgi:hypothetical protein